MPHTTNITDENLQECAAVKKLFEIEKARTGLTQVQLGEMIGKTDKSVSAIVNGKMRVTLDLGRKLAKVFGVPLAEILPWTSTLATDGKIADVIDDLQDLSDENLMVARRMVRNLLDTQEGS